MLISFNCDNATQTIIFESLTHRSIRFFKADMLEGIGPLRPLPSISLSRTINHKTFTSGRFRMLNRKANLQCFKLRPTLEKIWYLSREIVTTNPTACNRKWKKLNDIKLEDFSWWNLMLSLVHQCKRLQTLTILLICLGGWESWAAVLLDSYH